MGGRLNPVQLTKDIWKCSVQRIEGWSELNGLMRKIVTKSMGPEIVKKENSLLSSIHDLNACNKVILRIYLYKQAYNTTGGHRGSEKRHSKTLAERHRAPMPVLCQRESKGG